MFSTPAFLKQLNGPFEEKKGTYATSWDGFYRAAVLDGKYSTCST